MPHTILLNTESCSISRKAVLAQWRRILSSTLIWVFLAEFAVMLVLNSAELKWGYAVGLLDAAILSVLILPGLYLFVLRPVAAQAALNAVASANARFRDVVDAAGETIIVSDQGGKILFVNPAGLTMLGYSLSELMARQIDEVLPMEPDTSGQTSGDMHTDEGTHRHGIGRAISAHAIGHGDTSIPVEIKVSATTQPGGSLFVRVIRDLRRERRITLYESVLPVCCVCGDIRDDKDVEHGCGEWGSLEEFVKRRLTAEFSHAYCPQCKDEYLRVHGLNTQSRRSREGRETT